MRPFPLILACFLASCSDLKYAAVAPNGGTENLHLTTFGGSQSLESAGGTRYTSNHNKTAGQFFSAVTAVATVGANAYVGGAKEVTSRAVSANTSKATINASNNATKVELGKQATDLQTAQSTVLNPNIPH